MKINRILSKHAAEQLELRGINEKMVLENLENALPSSVQDGLTIYQHLVKENDKQYLIRIFVNESVNPHLIVTVYKTSKINKYK